MDPLDEWRLSAAGVAFHQPSQTAVVADLHLGYAEARERAGEVVPRVSLHSILQPLMRALHAFQTPRLVIAGDLFEAGFSSPVVQPFLSWLKEQPIELLALVPGNHDRAWKKATLPFPLAAQGYMLGTWHIVHGDRPHSTAQPTVQGHIHPCLRWRGVTTPCYLMKEDHLILPAYSAEAAGGNVLTEQWSSYRCLGRVGAEVLDFGMIEKLQAGGRRRQG